ncbi:hypothetical protein [Methyloraptor flagellatus]|jgi:hypothetical protein|uniref:CopL family metal-binding regulatory protein n=1 Tax=Methyloraptor flagellatus TaxID=3162530 RepID=A0AAU7X7F7_9HYPH
MIRIATVLAALLTLLTLGFAGADAHAVEPCPHHAAADVPSSADRQSAEPVATMHGHVATLPHATARPHQAAQGHAIHASAAAVADGRDRSHGPEGCPGGCMDMGLCRHVTCAVAMILPVAPPLPLIRPAGTRRAAIDVTVEGRDVAPPLDPPRSPA